MAAEVVNDTITPALGQELVEVMDDYATLSQLYLTMSSAPTRTTQINGLIATMNANQAALEAYAAAAGHDLTAAKAAGIATKIAYAAAHDITLTS